MKMYPDEMPFLNAAITVIMHDNNNINPELFAIGKATLIAYWRNKTTNDNILINNQEEYENPPANGYKRKLGLVFIYHEDDQTLIDVNKDTQFAWVYNKDLIEAFTKTTKQRVFCH